MLRTWGVQPRLIAIAAASAALLLIAAAPAGAANRFAEVGGNGGEPCLQSDPCPIAVAINGASGGTNDDVTLLGGLPPAPYVVATALSIPANVTVHGAPGARPVIQSDIGNAPAVELHSGSTLRDVVVEYSGINNPAVRLAGGGTLERVTAHATGTSTSGGCATQGGGTMTIRDSICRHGDPGGANGGGIEARNDSANPQTLVLRNVTAVSSNARPGLFAVRSGGGTLDVFATNVIAQSGSGSDVGQIAALSANTITLDHSNYDSEMDFNPGSITNPGTGTNQTTPPVFVDAAAGDFRQLPTSTGTINLGVAGIVNGVALGTLDFEGQARTSGPLPDIGADELPPPPPAPSGLGTSPASGSNDNSPFLFGTAEAGATVEAFLSGDCSGTAFDTGTASEFASPGFQVTPALADNSATQLSARAINIAGPGPCSAALAYQERTPPPPTTTTPAETGQRAAALKKCKKKKSKKARKKCRKRARRLPV